LRATLIAGGCCYLIAWLAREAVAKRTSTS
jgi:hypothetical protein